MLAWCRRRYQAMGQAAAVLEAVLVDEPLLPFDDDDEELVPLVAALLSVEALLLPDESPSDVVDSFGRAGTPDDEPDRLSVL